MLDCSPMAGFLQATASTGIGFVLGSPGRRPAPLDIALAAAGNSSTHRKAQLLFIHTARRPRRVSSHRTGASPTHPIREGGSGLQPQVVSLLPRGSSAGVPPSAGVPLPRRTRRFRAPGGWQAQATPKLWLSRIYSRAALRLGVSTWSPAVKPDQPVAGSRRQAAGSAARIEGPAADGLVPSAARPQRRSLTRCHPQVPADPGPGLTGGTHDGHQGWPNRRGGAPAARRRKLPHHAESRQGIHKFFVATGGRGR